MAWGYWSAASVTTDRVRSPRRNNSSISFASVSHNFPSTMSMGMPYSGGGGGGSINYHHQQQPSQYNNHRSASRASSQHHIYGQIGHGAAQSAASLAFSNLHLHDEETATDTDFGSVINHHSSHHQTTTPHSYRRNGPHHYVGGGSQQHVPRFSMSGTRTMGGYSTGGSASEDEDFPSPVDGSRRGGPPSVVSRRPSFTDIEFSGPVPAANRPLSLIFNNSMSNVPSAAATDTDIDDDANSSVLRGGNGVCGSLRKRSRVAAIPATNTYPRSYSHNHHHHSQGGHGHCQNDVLQTSKRSMTAAPSTYHVDSWYHRGELPQQQELIQHHHHANGNCSLRSSVRSRSSRASGGHNNGGGRDPTSAAECLLHHQHSAPPLLPPQHHQSCRIHHRQMPDYLTDDDDDDEEPDPTYAILFPNEPPHPGAACKGEDKSIYRRGARRWKKLYRVNGHEFQAKRFNKRATCEYCRDRIWGLGRQGFKCTQCKLLIHKKCHKLIRTACNQRFNDQTPTPKDKNGETAVFPSTPSPPTLPLGARRELELERDNRDLGHPVEEPQMPGGQSQRHYSLEDFELIRVIGRGSYAKVLMVELKTSKRIYAMKVIKKALVTEDEDIDWVQTEKHVFETASNHPFLVGLHSCFQTPSRLFFVIEFVRGGDLMFHMQRKHRLSEDHARFYSAEISLALNFLHERGIIYRDLKLDNVLLDHEGHIKLTDYGMCKEGIRGGDTTSTFCGTPNYIAPEILRGEEYGFSVDWWALGVLLYEMLAGRSPFNVGDSGDLDQNSEDYLFQIILDRNIRIPRSITLASQSILRGFLTKIPSDRLGCREGGFVEIQNHKFFNPICWEELVRKAIPPPYRPTLVDDRDLANFPPEFTDEPVHLTPDDGSIIDSIDQTEFEGFEYVNPLLMSMEDCV